MAQKKKKFSELELEIMDAIWDVGGAVTVKQIHQKLYPNREKAYTTVQTVMNILTDKGFLQRKKTGNVNFYRPTLSRKQAAKMETQKLVRRLFHGSFGALAHYLIDSGELTREDLEELRALIEKKKP